MTYRSLGAAGAAAAQAPGPIATVARGAAVRALQNRLAATGRRVGTIDGVAGPILVSEVQDVAMARGFAIDTVRAADGSLKLPQALYSYIQQMPARAPARATPATPAVTEAPVVPETPVEAPVVRRNDETPMLVGLVLAAGAAGAALWWFKFRKKTKTNRRRR